MKRFQMRAMLALSVALSVAGMSHAGVVEKLPADSLVVIKVSNLQATNTKIGKLAGDLGLTFFQPKLADPLKYLKQEMKITDGLQEDGEFAIVMVDPKEGRPDQSVIMLIPTSDYAALVGGLEGVTKEGDLSVMRQGGQNVYFADWGGYAAGSPDKNLVSNAPSKPLELNETASQEWDSNDLCIYANIDAIREPLLESIASGKERMQNELPSELQGNASIEEKYHPAIIALAEQAFGVSEAFLRDTESATIGVSLTDAGIKQSIVASFVPDSYLAKMANSFKTTDSSLLTNLPGESFTMFGGILNSPEAMIKIFDDITGPAIEKLPSEDEESKQIVELITESKKLFSRVKNVRQASISVDGAGGLGAGPTQEFSIADVEGENFLKDARALQEKFMPLGAKIMSLVTNGVEWNQTYTPEAKVVDGVSFDLSITEIVGDSDQANFMRQMMVQSSGSEKVEQYIGMIDQHLVTFRSASDDSVSSLIASVKAGGAPLSELEHVKSVVSQLPEERMAEFYLSGEPIFKTALMLARMQMPVPQESTVTLQPDLPPIGVSLSHDEGTLRITSFVSTELMQGMVTAGIQIGTEMMQGGGGRRGGGI